MADDPIAPNATQPASQRALARLRAIAQGNGVAPDEITLQKSNEAVYRLTGELRLTASWGGRALTVQGCTWPTRQPPVQHGGSDGPVA